MATWNLSPQHKKSAVEKMFFFNDGKVITIEQGFRWANFKVESDERPLTDEELKNEDGYELSCIANDECWEMWDMTDGCWLEIEKGNDKVSDEDLEAFEEAWEEDSYEGVEALGWSQDECEYYYYGPLELTNEDTGKVFQGEPDDTVPVTQDTVKEFVEGYADFVENMSDEEWENLGKEEEKSAYTDWFPVSTNPVREGDYQAMDTEVEMKWPFSSNTYAAHWDGKKWDKEVVMWRGLAENPNV